MMSTAGDHRIAEAEGEADIFHAVSKRYPLPSNISFPSSVSSVYRPPLTSPTTPRVTTHPAAFAGYQYHTPTMPAYTAAQKDAIDQFVDLTGCQRSVASKVRT